MVELCPLLFVGEAVSRGLEAVVLELDVRGAHRFAIAKLAHKGALREPLIGEVEKQLGPGAQGCGVIGKHDAMLACFKLVKVEQPLFGSEAVHKFQVGFPVLDAVLALGVLIFQGKGVVGDAGLLQQDADDLLRALALEDAGVMAQAQSPQGRFDLGHVAGAAKAAVPLGELAHHPAHPSLQLAVEPHQQLAGLIEHGGKVDIALLAG